MNDESTWMSEFCRKHTAESGTATPSQLTHDIFSADWLTRAGFSIQGQSGPCSHAPVLPDF
jgi:hypothetical protein